MNTGPELDSIERQVFASMSALLERAGLEYRGSFLALDGRRIHYLDYGEGPPVILLHGGGAGSAIWFRQIEVLSRTRRVIAPDHPVFGLSSQVPYKAPFPELTLQYITGFMDALGIEAADVVALSLGGQMALAMALASPERINRLVVIDSAGLGREFPLIFRLATLPLVRKLIVRPNRWGQDNLFKKLEVVNAEFEDAEVYKQYAYDVTLMKGHAGAMRSSLFVITTLSGQKSIFTDGELRSITTPILAIWGAHDKMFPIEHGYRLAELAPNATLHAIDNSAHVPLLDNPDRVNELITGFLGISD
ncbi:MAG: alpha/beta hydrolase [Dehalococcoidia bacterium]|nr:alpha/beta hydrolase [Dehalococcoidia bacterium]